MPKLGDANDTLGKAFAEHGVPGFLSPKTYKTTWTDYQKNLVEFLNAETQGTEHADRSSHQMHTLLSRQPEHAALYNHAAMAHFNHFWWDSLSLTKTEPSDTLKKDIEEYFGSLDTLKEEMLEHAEAIFGNGFVWLMRERTDYGGGVKTGGKLRILCTYNAGSPYAEAFMMRQPVDRATGMNPTEQVPLNRSGNYSSQMNIPQNYVGSSGAYSIAGQTPHTAVNALKADPILCVNVWQHMWVPDYGLSADSKQIYLLAWWERINWQKVEERSSKSNIRGAGR